MKDKVILKNNIYIKNIKEKIGNFTIPCTFIDYKNNDTIQVYLDDKNKEKLNDENEIYGKIDCFIVIPEFVFNYFTVKISNTICLNNKVMIMIKIYVIIWNIKINKLMILKLR